MRGIRGMKTLSPKKWLLITVASITFLCSFFTTQRVPLTKIGGLMERSTMNGTPGLSNNVCGGIHPGFSEFKNSTGYLTASLSVKAESIDA